MKLYLSTICFLMCSIVFGQSKGNFKITGTIEGDYKGRLHLYYVDKNNEVVDYYTESKDGKFFFSGFLEEPVQGKIRLEDPSSIGWIYLDTGVISMKVKTSYSTHNVIEITDVQGSQSEYLQKKTTEFWKKTMASQLSDSVKNEVFFKEILSFVREYPNHNLSTYFITSGAMLSFTYKQVKELFEILSTEQQRRAKDNGLARKMESLKRTEIGSDYSFIAQPDTAGNLISGKELKYKYLLIEFWASWCHPCRQENPELVALYKKYKSKGFEILGVSVDNNRENWMEAIQKDRLPWVQVSDLKSENELATYYSVPGYPFNLLIDSNGKIVAKNLRNTFLVNKLNELFPE